MLKINEFIFIVFLLLMIAVTGFVYQRPKVADCYPQCTLNRTSLRPLWPTIYLYSQRNVVHKTFLKQPLGQQLSLFLTLKYV